MMGQYHQTAARPRTGRNRARAIFVGIEAIGILGVAGFFHQVGALVHILLFDLVLVQDILNLATYLSSLANSGKE
jgi:hypothetical protein